MSQIIDPKQITFGEEIGDGATAVVYKGTWGRKPVAIKAFKFSSEESFAHNEIETLQGINNANIINMYGFWNRKNDPFIIYELMEGGSLYDYLIKYKEKSINWNKRLNLIMQIVNGMDYLHHTAGIIHHDIKSLNILLDKEKMIAKIADFGFAKYSLIDLTKPIEPSSHARGTTRYMAPELFSSRPLTEKCDIWSFGAVLLEFSNRTLPFSALDTNDVLRALQTKSPLPIEFGTDTPKYIINLIHECLIWNPFSRPSFKQIKSNLEMELNNNVAKSQDQMQPQNLSKNKSLNKNIGIGQSTRIPEYVLQAGPTHTFNVSPSINQNRLLTNYTFVSKGSANGRPIYRGSNGGLFIYTTGGNKKYL